MTTSPASNPATSPAPATLEEQLEYARKVRYTGDPDKLPTLPWVAKTLLEVFVEAGITDLQFAEEQNGMSVQVGQFRGSVLVQSKRVVFQIRTDGDVWVVCTITQAEYSTREGSRGMLARSYRMVEGEIVLYAGSSRQHIVSPSEFREKMQSDLRDLLSSNQVQGRPIVIKSLGRGKVRRRRL